MSNCFSPPAEPGVYLTEIKNIGFIYNTNLGKRFDSQLGYVPKEGFSSVFFCNNDDSKIRITITNEGFRFNDHYFSTDSKLLAVGDSFTFGKQVSNSDTWPACLERKLNLGVDNGGVNGYGAAQALKRGMIEINKKKYSTFILSILVGVDFSRDRYSYKFGNPKPAVIQTNKGITWSPVSDPDKIGSSFHPLIPSKIFIFFYERSLIFSLMADYLTDNFNFKGNYLTKIHTNAADINSIIKWTIKMFHDVPDVDKILLLQYAENINSENVLSERKLILATAKKLSLKVVDTFNCFKKYKPKEIWFSQGGHHTPFGNKIVCNYLFKQAFKSKINKDGHLPAAEPHPRQ